MGYRGKDPKVVTIDTGGVVEVQEIQTSLNAQSARMDSRTISAMYPPAPLVGIKADDSTDDTTALQNFVNYIVNNNLTGELPKGVIKVTSPIHFPSGGNWGFLGVDYIATTIKQYTDNVPVVTLGDALQGSGGKWCHSISFNGISLTYQNPQPVTNTNAFNLVFNDMYYQCNFSKLNFNNGYYGVRVSPGPTMVGGPWGCTFDELTFGRGLTGGAMDWTGAQNAMPNNHFGRISVDAGGMTSWVFKNIKGYDFTIDNIEVFDAANGPGLLSVQAASTVHIGAIKVESGDYTKANAGQSLFDLQTSSKVKIGQFTINGSNKFDSTRGDITIFNLAGGGATGWFEIDVLDIATSGITGSVYLFNLNPSSGGWARVKYLHTDGNIGWKLSKTGSGSANEAITVDNWLNSRISQDKGDADYTILLGDPNTICFNTALTVPRTVNLPSDNYNIFNGLKYKIISYGAVNGTNTITIKCGGVTMGTLSADKTAIEFTYRRHASYAYSGFKITDFVTLP